MNILVLTLLIYLLTNYTGASTGDSSTFFVNCLRKCEINQCDDTEFIQPRSLSIHLRLLQWTCSDECDHECMWKTVDAFEKRGYDIPQFHGKWPFIRFLGIQEPASMIFSLMNFYTYYKGFSKFRKEVRPDSPFYWLWHIFSFVGMNGWVWSTVFHTRDFPKTEFLDYTFAFSIVLMHCYCMIMRILKDIPRFILIVISVFFMAFFANHVAYLRIGRFDYSYNMQVNVIVGCFTVICWFAWCAYNRHRQPYVWKLAVFVSMTSATTLLELIDYPPIFYIFDFHALWHLSTVPLALIFYSFIIDDSKYLRKQMGYKDDEKVFKEL